MKDPTEHNQTVCKTLARKNIAENIQNSAEALT